MTTSRTASNGPRLAAVSDSIGTHPDPTLPGNQPTKSTTVLGAREQDPQLEADVSPSDIPNYPTLRLRNPDDRVLKYADFETASNAVYDPEEDSGTKISLRFVPIGRRRIEEDSDWFELQVFSAKPLLQTLKDAVALIDESQSMDESRFFVNDMLILPVHTPAELGMSDGSIIKVARISLPASRTEML